MATLDSLDEGEEARQRHEEPSLHDIPPHDSVAPLADEPSWHDTDWNGSSRPWSARSWNSGWWYGGWGNWYGTSSSWARNAEGPSDGEATATAGQTASPELSAAGGPAGQGAQQQASSSGSSRDPWAAAAAAIMAAAAAAREAAPGDPSRVHQGHDSRGPLEVSHGPRDEAAGVVQGSQADPWSSWRSAQGWRTSGDWEPWSWNRGHGAGPKPDLSDPPAWPGWPYRRFWVQAVKRWDKATDVAIHRRAEKILRSLGWEMAADFEHLLESELVAADYLDKILKIIEAKAGVREDDDRRRAYRAIFVDSHRKKDETLSQYVLRRQRDFHNGQAYGLVFPDNLKATLLKEGAGLSEQNLQNLAALLGGEDGDPDRVGRALAKLDVRSDRLTAYEVAGENSGETSNYASLRGDADEGESSEMDEEEVLADLEALDLSEDQVCEVYAVLSGADRRKRTWKENKLFKAELRKDRTSFTKGAPPSGDHPRGRQDGGSGGHPRGRQDGGSGGRDRRMSREQLKKISRCRICNKKGHWAAECPEKGASKAPVSAFSFAAQPPSDAVAFSFISRTEWTRLLWSIGPSENANGTASWNFLATPEGHAILDIGATQDLIGMSAFRSLKECLANAGLKPIKVDAPYAIPAGIGGKATVDHVALVPISPGGRPGVLQMLVLKEDIPPLLSVGFLDFLDAQIFLSQDRVRLGRFGVDLPLKRLPSGHRTMSLIGWSSGIFPIPDDIKSKFGLGDGAFQLNVLPSAYMKESFVEPSCTLSDVETCVLTTCDVEESLASSDVGSTGALSGAHEVCGCSTRHDWDEGSKACPATMKPKVSQESCVVEFVEQTMRSPSCASRVGSDETPEQRPSPAEPNSIGLLVGHGLGGAAADLDAAMAGARHSCDVGHGVHSTDVLQDGDDRALKEGPKGENEVRPGAWKCSRRVSSSDQQGDQPWEPVGVMAGMHAMRHQDRLWPEVPSEREGKSQSSWSGGSRRGGGDRRRVSFSLEHIDDVLPISGESDVSSKDIQDFNLNGVIRHPRDELHDDAVRKRDAAPERSNDCINGPNWNVSAGAGSGTDPTLDADAGPRESGSSRGALEPRADAPSGPRIGGAGDGGRGIGRRVGTSKSQPGRSASAGMMWPLWVTSSMMSLTSALAYHQCSPEARKLIEGLGGNEQTWIVGDHLMMGNPDKDRSSMALPALLEGFRHELVEASDLRDETSAWIPVWHSQQAADGSLMRQGPGAPREESEESCRTWYVPKKLWQLCSFLEGDVEIRRFPAFDEDFPSARAWTVTPKHRDRYPSWISEELFSSPSCSTPSEVAEMCQKVFVSYHGNSDPVGRDSVSYMEVFVRTSVPQALQRQGWKIPEQEDLSPPRMDGTSRRRSIVNDVEIFYEITDRRCSSVR